jgi:folate-binding protein YgfZ
MSLSIAHSFLAQYDALHSRVAVVDRSRSDARLRVTGPDRREWLQGLLTNDISVLTAGRGCYAAYLTPQGRMLGDMRVFDRGDEVVLDVVADARDVLISRLDQFIIMEDVVLEDVSEATGCVSVVGPRAAATLAHIVGVDPATLTTLDEYAHVPVTFEGAAGFCASTREFGVEGHDVYLPAPQSTRLFDRLRDLDVPALDADVVTTARVEAGRPRYGVDMDEDTIPLEAGIEDRAISFTKGCYVGQEVVIRVLHRGQGRVARRLCRLVSEAPADVPMADMPWAAGVEIRAGGRAVGRLTSVCASPQRKRLLAIGMVHRDATAPGTSVEIATANGAFAAATVEALRPESDDA